jgi:hypothetical protein
MTPNTNEYDIKVLQDLCDKNGQAPVKIAPTSLQGNGGKSFWNHGMLLRIEGDVGIVKPKNHVQEEKIPLKFIKLWKKGAAMNGIEIPKHELVIYKQHPTDGFMFYTSNHKWSDNIKDANVYDNFKGARTSLTKLKKKYKFMEIVELSKARNKELDVLIKIEKEEEKKSHVMEPVIKPQVEDDLNQLFEEFKKHQSAIITAKQMLLEEECKLAIVSSKIDTILMKRKINV